MSNQSCQGIIILICEKTSTKKHGLLDKDIIEGSARYTQASIKWSPSFDGKCLKQGLAL